MQARSHLRLVKGTDWHNWRDPRKDPAFEAERDKRRESVLAEAKRELINTAGFRRGQNAPVSLIAAISGLSESTVRQYVRKQKFGSRGPLLTTFLSLQLLDRF